MTVQAPPREVAPPTRASSPAASGAHDWTLGRVVRLILLLVLALYFALPLVWMLLAPSKTDSQLVARNPYAFGSFANYATAWKHLLLFNDREIYRWIINSIWYSGATVVISVATAVPAGYALAATRIRGRQVILMATLISMITPAAARVLPLFLEINAVGLTDTAWSVILPSSFFPFGVYLAFVYFSTSLPRDVLDAARIDGSSESQLFSRIALPLAKPLVGLVSFFSFLGGWNDYFLPFVMLTSDRKYNLPVGLAALISGSPGINPGSTASNLPIARPEVALAGMVVVAPVAVAFIMTQKYVVSGILAGASKE